MQTQLSRLVQDDHRQARVSVAAALPLITQAQADRNSNAAEVQAKMKAAADTYGDLATPQVRTASPACCPSCLVLMYCCLLTPCRAVGRNKLCCSRLALAASDWGVCCQNGAVSRAQCSHSCPGLPRLAGVQTCCQGTSSVNRSSAACTSPQHSHAGCRTASLWLVCAAICAGGLCHRAAGPPHPGERDQRCHPAPVWLHAGRAAGAAAARPPSICCPRQRQVCSSQLLSHSSIEQWIMLASTADAVHPCP